MRSRQNKIDMGVIMYRHGALQPERYVAAVAATVEETGLAEDVVRQEWSEVQQFIQVMAARGVLRGDEHSDG